MATISAANPKSTTFQDYQKMIDRAKADCGVTVAESEVIKLEEQKDRIEHLSTLALVA